MHRVVVKRVVVSLAWIFVLGSVSCAVASPPRVRTDLPAVLFVTDHRMPDAVRRRIEGEAGDGVEVTVLQPPYASRDYTSERLQQLMRDSVHLVGRARLVVVAAAGDAAFYALFALGEQAPVFDASRVIVAGEFPAGADRVLAAALLRLLDAEEVVVAHDPGAVLGLWEIARTDLTGVAAPEEVQMPPLSAVTVRDVNHLGWWRRAVVGGLARAVLAQVPLEALSLILLLPLIATIIVVARLLVGIDSFGTFAPVIVSLAFVATGLRWGVVLFVVIVICGAFVRMLLQRLRLQLVSRMAILIATVAALMAALTVAGAILGAGPLLTASFFPMLIMSSIIENFAASQFEFGTREALRLTFNTLLLACLCYAAIDASSLRSMVLAYPELIAASVGINVALGKWRGLRLLEYLRFRDLASP